jgi:multicomponent Na+:H+ antiporter subunit E
MIHLALHLLLAIIWMLLTGDFSSVNLAFVLAVAFLALAFGQPVVGSTRYVRAAGGVIRLAFGFGRELVVANLQLARDILRPTLPFQPGFVAFHVPDLDRTETVILSNLLSLTPGSLSVDLDDEGHTLYIHTLYAGDPEETRRSARRLADLIHGALGHERPRPPEQE